MWRVPSGIERAKLSGPLVHGNRYKNLAKRLCNGMGRNGSHVSKRRRTPNCDPDEFNSLKDKPPYRDIRHTLCGVDWTARWDRSKDTGRHNTLHFANFNQVGKGMPINIGVILRKNMMKFMNNLRWRFYYGGLITRFLRAEGIEEETMDITVAYHPDLTGKLVDVTQTKALNTSHGPILSAQERQACDNSVIARMLGMAELQLRIRGCSVTDEEMETLADRYSLIENATFLCRSGPTFMEPLDDDEATVNKTRDEEEEDVVDEEPGKN
ncbi:hypothetical protein H5410_014467 [Solanum commersonii]|uniref:Uncharacterized protein n=1 Tax=Solanum commersonii TaxID=4109 RepID=A0A9J5ZRB6_SOLCO|nr:hypothetical protein H5410_014467 [Solanum commersonii]